VVVFDHVRNARGVAWIDSEEPLCDVAVMLSPSQRSDLAFIGLVGLFVVLVGVAILASDLADDRGFHLRSDTDLVSP
jgi:hypothetical protein